MRSKATIIAIVVGVIAICVSAVVVLVVALGAVGGLVAVTLAGLGLLCYRTLIGPWQHRWNATDEEVARTMPGDELLPSAPSTTRAITIDAPTDQVWPWLVQIGYGRAGWYSYDWIDNDGRPSADTIVEEFQDLQVGDRILMIPDMGPEVRAIEPGRHLVSGDAEGGIWCLALYPDAGGRRTRLISRWRANWPFTAATAFWLLISDPGAFIMERKMLKGIKRRAERAARTARATDDRVAAHLRGSTP
jgi:hypothetical protein